MIELDAGLEEYIERHTEKEPDVLAQLSRATHQKMLRPRMLSGNMQGQLLKMLCRMNRVQRVLEIGTFIRRSGLEERIVFHLGDACRIIPELDELFDLVFIDADKRQYAEYYRLVVDKVRPGGIIVADDVLWDGKVLDPDCRDAQTRGILEFNDLVQGDERVENLLLPIRHGLMLIRKKPKK